MECTQFRTREDDTLAACNTAGVVPGKDELNAPRLTLFHRYRIEPALEILLSKSTEFGFAGDLPQQVESEDYEGLINLLDLQDARGNTALHYAVAHRRPDLVGLLLCHGATVEIPNKDGIKVYDMCKWQEKSAFMNVTMQVKVDDDVEMKDANTKSSLIHDEIHPPSLSSSVQLLSPTSIVTHPQLYQSLTYVIERRWGTQEQLQLDCSRYKNETSEAAIKRLLFQRRLLFAVEAGDDGNLHGVQQLVKEWHKAAETYEMFPLVYRGDTDVTHPMQVAVRYLSENLSVLHELVKLPQLLHIQSRRFLFAALPLAALNGNFKAVDILLRAGWNINNRDIANGKTILHAIAQNDTIENDQTTFTECDSSYTTSSMLCEWTAKALVRGADPTIVDDNGNTPLITAVHHGQPELVSLYLQWNALNEARSDPTRSSIQSISKSSFLHHANIYGNTCLHYAFYMAFKSEQHFTCLKLLLSTNGWSDVHLPKNKLNQSPLELFTAPESPFGQRVCREILKMKPQQVQLECHPPRKRVKRRGKIKSTTRRYFACSMLTWRLYRFCVSVLMADLSKGLERFSIDVVTDYATTDRELATVQRDLTYIIQNRWSPPSDPDDSHVQFLDPNQSTISQTLDLEPFALHPPRSAKRVRLACDAGTNPAVLNDEDESPSVAEYANEAKRTQQLFTRGLAFKVQVQMTDRCGWGVFTCQKIPKGFNHNIIQSNMA